MGDFRRGRDAIDVQATVRDLLKRGVATDVHGLGLISQGVGELILAVLAQVADMEWRRIAERTAAGRTTAREHLARTGRSHKGERSATSDAHAWVCQLGADQRDDRMHVDDRQPAVAWSSPDAVVLRTAGN